MTRFKIIEIAGRQRRERGDIITTEFPLTVVVNSAKVADLACTPRDLKDLVVGYLYTRGFINGLGDILSLRIERSRHKAVVKTRSPLSPFRFRRQETITDPGFFVACEDIFRLTRRLQRRSLEFLKTGGTHCAALCSRHKILIFREDLGRHNALDKVIGAALLRDYDPGDKFILISSRISSEVLLKVVRSRIPLIASLSAPTDSAVRIARRERVTLIGFVRGDRFNIYSAADRVK